MKFESMREFVVLAETRNYYEAAEQLFISEATLSRHIKDLECEIGTQLFKRTTRRIDLTMMGSLLLPYAKQAVELQNNFTDTIQSYLTIMNETINIGYIPSDEEERVNKAIIAFKASHPNARFKIIQSNELEAFQMLNDNICNIIFVRERDMQMVDGRSRKLCYTSTLSVYMSENSPLHNKDELSIEELQNENFILPEQHNLPHEFTIELCHQAGFEPLSAFHGVKQSVMIHALSNGFGIALLLTPPPPFDDIEKTLSLYGIIHVKLKQRVTSSINIVYESARLNALEKEFVDTVGKMYASAWKTGRWPQT